MIQRTVAKTRGLIHFLTVDIWRIRLEELTARRAFILRYLRIIVLAVQGFDEDRCLLRASALTFYTLFSIVPVLAMSFGIAKGFGFDQALKARVMSFVSSQSEIASKAENDPHKNIFPDFFGPEDANEPQTTSSSQEQNTSSVSQKLAPTSNSLASGASPKNSKKPETAQEEMMKRMFNYAENMLEQTKGGLIVGIGVIFLFWSVLKVLGNIEESLNTIWGVTRGRSFGRRFSDYMSVVLVAPALVVLSSSLTVVISSRVTGLLQHFNLMQILGPIMVLGLKLLPYVFVWLLFSFLYAFLPNTRVPLKSALLAGIVAGTFYQIAQIAFLFFQFRISSMNAIYGTFAALPLFLMWVQISWLIVLFGGELCFAHQNVDTYEHEPDSGRVSYAQRRLHMLRMAQMCVQRFEACQPPLSPAEISHLLGLPVRLVREILFELTEAGILSEIKTDNKTDAAYQPARSTGSLTLKRIIDLYESHGTKDIPCAPTPEITAIAAALEDFSARMEQSQANCLVRDIASDDPVSTAHKTEPIKNTQSQKE
ncbi:MAG: YihY family inner membrane protein [Candidatus Sumerlaeota bacterium]|nr:YihY family inner membrane protein [Candidatus Sumerlaeota bacterium]